MGLLRKGFLGCSVLLILAALTVAAVWTVDWGAGLGDGSTGSDDETLALTRALEQELGHEPTVDLVCVYPVVGVGPCVPGRGGSREVTLVFDDYSVPAAHDPREHARRIAEFARESSAFAAESDKLVVVFRAGDEWASLTHRYSFPTDRLVTPPAT